MVENPPQAFGKFEYRQVSYSDTFYFVELLVKDVPDREFVLRVLIHQLIQNVTFNQLRIVSNEELERHCEEFIQGEADAFQYLENTDSCFGDFKRALAKKYEERVDNAKNVASAIELVQDQFHSFRETFADVLGPAIQAQSFLKEVSISLSDVAQQLNNINTTSNLGLAEVVKISLQPWRDAAEILKYSLAPKIDSWQKWVENNNQIFKSFEEFWKESQIAEADAVPILQKYKWFITPSLPAWLIYSVAELAKEPGRQDKAINALFIQCFEADNWLNLHEMVDEWKNNPLVAKRHKILKDCVDILQMKSKTSTNKSNVILPTLITQIDGMLSDYLNSKGIAWEAPYDDHRDRKTGKVTKAGRKSRFQALNQLMLSPQLDAVANDVFLNILFQGSQKGSPLVRPFSFNRHKIIHGENVTYGKKVFIIRAFMILDLLISLN